MTHVGNAFDSYDAVGNREDLTDLISMISPLEAPAFDRWGKVKATARTHEWQTDALATAAANRNIEGASFTASTLAATTRYTNVCQVMIKQFAITDTQEVVDKAGRKSEIAYQRKKAMLELKRDAEFAIFVSAGASGHTGLSDLAPAFKNVQGWQVNVGGHTGIANASGSTGAGVLTEKAFNEHLQRAWNDGAKINTVYTAGALKRLISDWGLVASTRPRDGGESRRIVNVVDFYLSDFGELEIVLDRYVPTSQMFLLDDNLWKTAFLVPTREKSLGDTGLASNTMIWNQWTIEARNPTGNAMLWSAP